MTPVARGYRVRVPAQVKAPAPRESERALYATKGLGDRRMPDDTRSTRRRIPIQGAIGLYEDYDAYLASPEWFTRRHAILERDERCRLCDRGGHLHVHHRTYERVGHELPTDLLALCDECHAWFHVPRSERLLEEGESLARRTDREGLDARRVAMHLARGLRMDKAGG